MLDLIYRFSDFFTLLNRDLGSLAGVVIAIAFIVLGLGVSCLWRAE